MTNPKIQEAAPLCACGCGEPVSVNRESGGWRTYRHGHYARVNHNRYRGGFYTARGGYVYIRQPEHPRANLNGYVRRSIVVAEKALGRRVTIEEHVHHKNRDTSDDRPENIEVVSPLEHKLIHAKLTTETAAEIRALKGVLTGRALAKRYGVNPATISRVLLGQAWRDEK